MVYNSVITSIYRCGSCGYLLVMFIYLSVTENSCLESHHKHNQEIIGMVRAQALVILAFLA